MKTISFFGHRQILNKEKVKALLLKVLQEIIPQGYSKLLIGTHGDFDNIALSTSIFYKKNVDHELSVNIVLTSLSLLNKDKFGFSMTDFYKDNECETVFYEIEDIYFKKRITFSNKKMVDDSDLIICYVNMNSYKSGAKKTISYALKQNKKVINLFNY